MTKGSKVLFGISGVLILGGGIAAMNYSRGGTDTSKKRRDTSLSILFVGLVLFAIGGMMIEGKQYEGS